MLCSPQALFEYFETFVVPILRRSGGACTLSRFVL
jgi:hypothetical protein